MHNSIKIISFYTTDTPYEKVMYEYLFPSIKKFELEWYIAGLPNLKSWAKNTSAKPHFILEALERNYNKSNRLIFLDADATIEKYPQLFHDIPEEYDIACHYLDWDSWYNNGQNKKELLSGTMYIRDSKVVRGLIKEWANRAKKDSKWEQNILQDLLVERPEIKVYPLPLEYCYIKTLPSGHEPRVTCDPVIAHHQVSRMFKKIIDKGL